MLQYDASVLTSLCSSSKLTFIGIAFLDFSCGSVEWPGSVELSFCVLFEFQPFSVLCLNVVQTVTS